MADGPQHQIFSAKIAATDPLADQAKITVSYLNLSPVQRVQASPLSVSNWEGFRGVLLAVCIKYGDTYVVDGTAVMIGVGLALSARHVFDDHRHALAKGEAELVCFGMRPDGALDVWRCYAMSRGDPDDGDLELLSLKLVSDLPADHNFMVTPLTTRIPPPGETLMVAGFRFEDSVSTDSIHDPVTLGGMMYVSKGSAGDFSYPIHDSVLAPYPTIEISSGSLGGMSGGAVLDVNGHLVGITSLGLETDDRQGPTLAAWWMQALFWRTNLTWPPGLYDESVPLWRLPTVYIVGREYVHVRDEPHFSLTRWT